MPISFVKGPWPKHREPLHCYFFSDKWDDFGFKTTYEPLLIDSKGISYELGAVKIMKRGMTGDYPPLDETFEQLSSAYCSLGQSQNYYEQLRDLPYEIQRDYLIALRDCVDDPHIYTDFRNEQAFGTSLARYVPLDMLNRFRDALHGQVKQTAFHFVFNGKPNRSEDIDIDVRVTPRSTPPTNIHVIIGRNGVGKTRIISGIERAVLQIPIAASSAMPGGISFPGDTQDKAYFSNLVTVAFSAFDRFEPIEEKESRDGIRYSYIGLKLPGDLVSPPRLKHQGELTEEFAASLRASLAGVRRRRWLDIIGMLNDDPLLADLNLDEITDPQDDLFKKIVGEFDDLSSGHKIVVLTMTRLVEFVEERTLVLIDEPESHLHPPLLGSFIRALSRLLKLRNGVAIVATHSPVVLQEVPKSCVSIVRRSGDVVTVNRPSMETFAENVGSLTDDVFELRVTESGFHSLLRKYVDDGDSYESIIDEFGGQIGDEGRAILRAMVLERDS